MARWLMIMVLIDLLGSASLQADWANWWLTPDQQGQRLFEAGEFAAAAEKFTTPDRIGAALYQAGDFAGAAAVFGRTASAAGAFNRGNALVMGGLYADAIESYELALRKRPGWSEAEQNLAIALARKAALAPPEDDAGGTGGKLAADEIVFDDSGRVAKSEQEQVIEAGDQSLSEQAMRAMWLRRVETRPADFLSAKFSYQLYAAGAGDDQANE